MYDEQILSSLRRQHKAMELLRDLLLEEFDLLVARDTEAIVHLEFSLHELLRQIASEKTQVIQALDGQKVHAYAQTLDEETREAVLELLQTLDKLEQRCARQASQNAELSLGLLDQSRTLLNTLYARISPKTGSTYGKRGAMRSTRRPEAALLVGRL
ncbi:MAG: flagellar protein FlgN [Deltaproteobacteria bacterium]|nr:flagellar protein FlgN [Deltaproteobacteria bacterium]